MKQLLNIPLLQVIQCLLRHQVRYNIIFHHTATETDRNETDVGLTNITGDPTSTTNDTDVQEHTTSTTGDPMSTTISSEIIDIVIFHHTLR